MYKWNVKVTLKSGNVITGYTKSKYVSSNDVFSKEMLPKGCTEKDFTTISVDEGAVAIIKVGDISAVELRCP